MLALKNTWINMKSRLYLKMNEESLSDMFRQKRERDKLDEAYLEMLEKINDSQMNMMSSALKLMRKKKEEGEI